MTQTRETVVLAYSGGLDTSFCVPYLNAQGYDVVTVFVDTGGVDAEELAYIEARSAELGAIKHITAQAGPELSEEFIIPLVQGGQKYQDQYPLLCSDRYIIVRKCLEVCQDLGTKYFAHGCTGMGNDQVRFDLTVKALGDFTILAPIREIQREHDNVRVYEQQYLEELGFSVRAKTTRYTINENVLGVTISGSEVDDFGHPGPETYKLTAPRAEWPEEALTLEIEFEEGVPVAVNGERAMPWVLVSKLNHMLGPYGVGRHMYCGDTTIGLKGRIVFEAPGLEALLTAHRALEESICTHQQNSFKHMVARKWVDLVYTGFFYEPLKFDLEAFIKSSQRFVNGTVKLETFGGSIHAVKIDSPHILRRSGAVYAQSADWGATEAEGFIKLFGQSSTLSAAINPLDLLNR